MNVLSYLLCVRYHSFRYWCFIYYLCVLVCTNPLFLIRQTIKLKLRPRSHSECPGRKTDTKTREVTAHGPKRFRVPKTKTKTAPNPGPFSTSSRPLNI